MADRYFLTYPKTYVSKQVRKNFRPQSANFKNSPIFEAKFGRFLIGRSKKFFPADNVQVHSFQKSIGFVYL